MLFNMDFLTHFKMQHKISDKHKVFLHNFWHRLQNMFVVFLRIISDLFRLVFVLVGEKGLIV